MKQCLALRLVISLFGRHLSLLGIQRSRGECKGLWPGQVSIPIGSQVGLILLLRLHSHPLAHTSGGPVRTWGFGMDLKGSLEETSQVVKSQGLLGTSISNLTRTLVPVHRNRNFFL